ncbi:hypothetical protein QAD02_000665 [Eretmocerus hayati]|uniref:Uncharacterized protein n=1 Tax=Eretmocerus hayati TaxID=131215 RepID=A0ACC2NEV5_9HYME|nr:hypothetical protein QAD02_000665 [Eretmocerus hayati]
MYKFSLLVTSKVHSKLIENVKYLPPTIVPEQKKVQKSGTRTPFLPAEVSADKTKETRVTASAPKPIMKKISEFIAPVVPSEPGHVEMPSPHAHVDHNSFRSFNGSVPEALYANNFKRNELPSEMKRLMENSIRNSAFQIPNRQVLTKSTFILRISYDTTAT